MGERTNRADSSTARSSARSCSTALDSAVVEGTTSPGFASLHCLYAPEIGNCSDNRHLTVSSQLVTEVTDRFTPRQDRRLPLWGASKSCCRKSLQRRQDASPRVLT